MLAIEKNEIETILQNFIFPILPYQLAAMIREVPISQLTNLTEIRLRVNKPLLLVLGNVDIMLTSKGKFLRTQDGAYRCDRDDIHTTLQLISKNSLYAFEQELKMGFITIHGGHRIGLAGQAIVDGGEIKSLKNISSLNIRMAREIKGCGRDVIPYLIGEGKRVVSTLLISAPCCGKTTLLRDLIRQISTGNTSFPGVQVGVVDERSEIGACKNGIPTVDLGPRTDILDACPKASGMLMLIRSMSPAVIATDELGRAEDLYAVREALHAGVSVLATVHGRDSDEVMQRPYVGELIQGKYFERYIILSDQPKVGTIEKIIDSKRNEVLWMPSSVDILRGVNL
ncbi:stage III sporulation protein AA [Pelosinus sp. sgz500959]|uniref:stage III sporulation protein AA n=1 Tax=Pelosinus sp. sgz500959 TaxID=3242472 RepID=UPI00366EE646